MQTPHTQGILSPASVSSFVNDLNTTTTSYKSNITQSSATISSIVNILGIVASVSQNISETSMRGVLETVSILVSAQAKESWAGLNSNNRSQSTSSALLESIENITHSLSSNSFTIITTNIELIKTTLIFPFNETLNSSQIIIPSQSLPNNTSITTIVFTTLDFVLPARTTGNSMDSSINGIVMLAYINETINNVLLTFDKTNKTKGNSHCVSWNFEGTGGWDSTGCKLDSETNVSVTCSCNHLTSFSILMSPYVPEYIEVALNYITYIGVSISMGCLVLCLIIEAFVWSVVTKNSTSHMRHVAIVNIALSLLIADIWFIIGAAVSGQSALKNVCSAATFFIHFFYLALFFWMLISALFLFYHTMWVFSHIPKRTMMAISFSVGYGAPLIIAIITIAVTAPKNGYFGQDSGCWLNWYQIKALLAFLIPALIIVVVNLLILIVILVKLLMRGVGENRQSEEKNALVVIARCVAVLTPIFGITWGLGIGTMVAPDNLGIQIVFTVFNAFQGCFILVFGMLIDSRIRSAIVGRFSFLPLLSSRTKSTNAGPSLSSLADRMRRRGKTIEIEVDYVIDIEVTVSDIAMVNDMRDLLRGTPFPHPLTNTIKISEVDITTGSVTSTTISTPNTTAGSLTNTTTSTAITTAGFATNSTTAPALATSRLATSSPTSIPNTTAGFAMNSTTPTAITTAAFVTNSTTATAPTTTGMYQSSSDAVTDSQFGNKQHHFNTYHNSWFGNKQHHFNTYHNSWFGNKQHHFNTYHNSWFSNKQHHFYTYHNSWFSNGQDNCNSYYNSWFGNKQHHFNTYHNSWFSNGQDNCNSYYNSWFGNKQHHFNTYHNSWFSNKQHHFYTYHNSWFGNKQHHFNTYHNSWFSNKQHHFYTYHNSWFSNGQDNCNSYYNSWFGNKQHHFNTYHNSWFSNGQHNSNSYYNSWYISVYI
ncbi:adhesion G protein-coupled receptor F4-like [Paramormyrops kingsleyae]|uniref:adhesion G protein-coupled receptor F4-like n=1 Tax=Paramormyrops kingsleyae TaxID=1676925 RepID=UPI003B97A6FA